MKKSLVWFATLSWAYFIFILTTTPDLRVTNNTLLSLFLSYAGHIFFFGIQALLLRLSLTANYSIIATSLYGFIIELVQTRVPTRSADPLDWALDTLGAILVIYLINITKSHTLIRVLIRGKYSVLPSTILIFLGIV